MRELGHACLDSDQYEQVFATDVSATVEPPCGYGPRRSPYVSRYTRRSLEHLLHVGPRLRERDVAGRSACPSAAAAVRHASTLPMPALYAATAARTSP